MGRCQYRPAGRALRWARMQSLTCALTLLTRGRTGHRAEFKVLLMVGHILDLHRQPPGKILPRNVADRLDRIKARMLRNERVIVLKVRAEREVPGHQRLFHLKQNVAVDRGCHGRCGQVVKPRR